MSEKVVSANELQFIGEDDEIAYLSGEDTPFTGKVEDFYDNGQKLEEGNYKDGKQDGLWTRWQENGQKSRERNYKDGKQDGLETWYYTDGTERFRSTYKDGELVED